MQTQEDSYANIPEYDDSEEIFFDMKLSEEGDVDSSFYVMTEDQMPIPTTGEEETECILNDEGSKEAKKGGTALESKKSSQKKQVNQVSATKTGKNQKPEISLTNVKVRREATYNIAEISFSKAVKVMKKNQGDRLLKVRILPAVNVNKEDFAKVLNKDFENAAVYETDFYTELIFNSKVRIGIPYTASDTAGVFSLCIPYQSKKSRFSLRKGLGVADGLTYYKDRGKSGQGFSDVHILRIEALANKIKVVPALANEGIAQRESLSSMAKRYNAVAGINGSYFTWRGDPIGTLIINRKLISSPLYKRSVFGINDNDSLVFGNPDFSGVLKSDEVSLEIDAVNQPRRGSSLVVFTPEYARSTLTDELGVEFVVVKGKIVGIHKKDALIPPDGVVVSAGGAKAAILKKLRLGQNLKLDYSIDSPWNNIKHALCGGPRLLANGRVSINGKEEKFDASIISGRHPRTAVAVTYDGDLLLIVVDGRKKDSPGMKLDELAEYLRRLGCMHAINLDGGGSTAMYLNGRIVNKPSDGTERKISNGILVTMR